MEFKFVNKTLDELGNIYIDELAERLIDLGKQASGDLIESLDYDVIKTTEGFILELKALEYLKWVDVGRRPGSFPPPPAIEKWIKDKGLKFRDKKGRFIKTKSAAFLVGRKIKERGIKPTNVLEDTIKSILVDNEDLLFAFKDDIERILTEMISKIKIQK